MTRLQNWPSSKQRQAGLSALEYVIAVVIILVVFTAWLQLTSTAIQNGNFVKRLADVGNLASFKANELSANADAEVEKLLTANLTTGGAIAPLTPVPGYFDEFDETGKPALSTGAGAAVFRRQWTVVRDKPNVGDVTFVVSVSYIGGAGKVLRLAKIINTESAITIGN
jgi:hypothetical protein